MEVTKVTLDAGDQDQILVQFWQGSSNYHTVYLYPQEGKKFELFRGIDFKDETILMEQVAKETEKVDADAN
jgi:hypothetical protein|tara:strand:+ start:1132 stop:1344 length:213 start_codon:yes stop_codon:yes gene_type:complete